MPPRVSCNMFCFTRLHRSVLTAQLWDLIGLLTCEIRPLLALCSPRAVSFLSHGKSGDHKRLIMRMRAMRAMRVCVQGSRRKSVWSVAGVGLVLRSMWTGLCACVCVWASRRQGSRNRSFVAQQFPVISNCHSIVVQATAICQCHSQPLQRFQNARGQGEVSINATFVVVRSAR